MPVLMPTRDELTDIPWHSRQRIRKSACDLVAALDDLNAYATDGDATLTRTTAKARRRTGTVRARAAAKRRKPREATEFGQRVRALALSLEQFAAPDPDDVIEQRRAALLEAIA